MSRSTIALVLFIVAVILAALAALELPYSARLLPLAVAFAAAGLAVEAA
jgi:archaellum component FlaG (FlaF/FlaG flagellin family)